MNNHSLTINTTLNQNTWGYHLDFEKMDPKNIAKKIIKNAAICTAIGVTVGVSFGILATASGFRVSDWNYHLGNTLAISQCARSNQYNNLHTHLQCIRITGLGENIMNALNYTFTTALSGSRSLGLLTGIIAPAILTEGSIVTRTS